MNDQNNKELNDKEIRDLLKWRLLEQVEDDDLLTQKLIDMEAKLAFDSEALYVPSLQKQKKLLKRLQSRRSSFFKWFLSGLTLFTIVALCYYFSKRETVSTISSLKKEILIPSENHLPQQKNDAIVIEDSAFSKKQIVTTLESINKNSKEKIQLVKIILKENADCNHSILVTDSIVFSPNSPKGTGNDLEIKDNSAEDPKFFESEHNTVWYRYIAPDNGQLTFDIIPISKNDDYDFMLYKFKGMDLQNNVRNKTILPVRSCISRNDKNLKGMTGLKADPQLPVYIHSGQGASYVKYIDVNKNDVFYLLVDNVYENGNGHTIRFHLKPIIPGEIYVGQTITFQSITFLDSDYEFKKGSEKGLDSLYNFLVQNPKIKVEVQGHANATKNNQPIHIYGKPICSLTQLTQKRAEVIVAYLVKRGISHDRLTAQGYGSTRKKIENPKTIKENIMNVRAEINILSLDYKEEQ